MVFFVAKIEKRSKLTKKSSGFFHSLCSNVEEKAKKTGADFCQHPFLKRCRDAMNRVSTKGFIISLPRTVHL